jgi:hypothetical protein
MSLLGCNSKLLWHEIYTQIIDIISAKTDKSGIIVCKYFHEIHSELLENFYSYMQQNNAISIDIKFIIITEELSFISDNILNCCEIINIGRPSKTNYNKCLKNKLPIKFNLENITNIKTLNLFNEELMLPYKMICNKIIDNMTKINESSKELVKSNYGITLGTSHDIYRAYILEPTNYQDYDPTIKDFVAKLKTYHGLLIAKNYSADLYTKAFSEMTEAANNVVNTDFTQVIEFTYLRNDDAIHGLIDLIQNYSSRLNTKNASSSCNTVFDTVNYLEEKPDIFRFPTNAYSGLSIFQWATQAITGAIVPIFTDPFHISNASSQIPDFIENSEEIDKYKGNEINTVISAFSNSKMKTGCQQFPNPNIKIKLVYVQKEPATNWKEWIGDNFKSLQGNQNHTVKFVRMEITGRLSSAKVGSLITQLTFGLDFTKYPDEWYNLDIKLRDSIMLPCQDNLNQ